MDSLLWWTRHNPKGNWPDFGWWLHFERGSLSWLSWRDHIPQLEGAYQCTDEQRRRWEGGETAPKQDTKIKGTWNDHFRKYGDVYVQNNTISYSHIPPVTWIRAFTCGHVPSFPLSVVYRCWTLKLKKKKKKNQSCPKRNEEVRALPCLARATAHDALSGLSNILNFHLPAPSPL